MKKHGLLRTSSQKERRDDLTYDPLKNFFILFRGPFRSGVYDEIADFSKVQKQYAILWEVIMDAIKHGPAFMHVAIFDYYCQVHHLGLDIAHFESREEMSGAPCIICESILLGDWPDMKGKS